MYFIEGTGTIYMASALPNLKNTTPALPNYKDHQKYYITLGSMLVAMTIFHTILNIAFFKALKEHYYAIENALLLKSRKSISEVEKARTSRVEQNMLKKREEKGLNTVMETMNESDQNKTPNPSKNKTRFRNMSSNQDTHDVIKEESYSDNNKESKRNPFSHRQQQYSD